MAIQPNVEEFLCVICREIMIDPVTLPCFHSSCLPCLEKTLDSNKYQCFLCRKFIGSWYRNAKRRNELINHKLFSIINDNFSHLVQMKLSGETVDILPPVQPFKISSPGEIKEEFDAFMQKINGEIHAQQEKENKLSEEFIKLLEEEERQVKVKQEEILKRDEVIARELASLINTEENIPDESIPTRPIFNNFKSVSENRGPLKKLSFTRRSPLSKSKIMNQKKNKHMTSSVSIVGPMDRFVGKN